VQGGWVRSIAVGLVTGITAVAIGVPIGLAGHCVAGYCLVAVPGADGATAATRGVLDSWWRDAPTVPAPAATRGILHAYWRGAPSAASADSTVGGSRETLLVSARRAFSWGDFGIGISAALGALLVLVGVAGARGFRVSRDGAAGQAEAA